MIELATQAFRNLMLTQVPTSNEMDYLKNAIGKPFVIHVITFVLDMLLLDIIFSFPWMMHETLCDIHVVWR